MNTQDSTKLPPDVVEDLVQLNKIRATLSKAGFSVHVVQRRPEQCVRAILQKDDDWRDAFLAALGSGLTPGDAEVHADASADIMKAHRLKAAEADTP